MSVPLVSVIMTVYNCEKYIEEALESIFHQTFRDFEVIVSSKDVVYDPEDVCMNPTTNECTLDGLRYSIYFSGENYFAFLLPPNTKFIPYILVPRSHVQIVMVDEDQSIHRFLDEVFNQID